MTVSRSARIILSFASIYLLWGGSYLAIHYTLESFPPLIVPGLRFTAAGLLVIFLARRGGAALPNRHEWRSAGILGFLMIFLANGALMIGQLTVPSSIAATLYATLPFWVALLGWLWQGEARPNWGVVAGLIVGFIGIVLLFSPETGGQGLDWLGGGLILFSSFMWAYTSLLSRRLPSSSSPLMTAGVNLLVGGLCFLIASTLTGEWAQIDWSRVSTASILSVLYLTFGASTIAFTSYIWLMTVTTPNSVATYAYVNPVVALLLGVFIGGEALTGQSLLASLVIVAAVILITTYRGRTTAAPAKSVHSTVLLPAESKALAGGD